MHFRATGQWIILWCSALRGQEPEAERKWGENSEQLEAAGASERLGGAGAGQSWRVLARDSSQVSDLALASCPLTG